MTKSTEQNFTSTSQIYVGHKAACLGLLDELHEALVAHDPGLDVTRKHVRELNDARRRLERLRDKLTEAGVKALDGVTR